jgi:tetratricopeptide (TPR) repeat protein
MLHSVRSYAADHLAAEAPAALRAHGSWFARWGTRRCLADLDAVGDVGRLYAERADVVEAAERGLRTGHVDVAIAAALAACVVYTRCGPLPAAVDLLDRVLAACGTTPRAVELAVQRGWLAVHLGDLAVAERWFEVARDAAGDAADADLGWAAQRGLAEVQVGRRRFRDAERLYLALPASVSATNDAAASAKAGLARIAFEEGRLVECDHLLREAAGMLDGADNGVAAMVLNNLARLHHLRGEFEEAVGCYRRCEVLLSRMRDERRACTARGNLAFLLQVHGRREEARAMHLELLPRQREMGDKPGELVTIVNLALLDQEDGRLDDAERAARSAIEVARDLDDPEAQVTILGNLAIILDDTGRPDEAEACYRSALAIARRDGLHATVASVAMNLGVCLGNRGRDDEAIAWIQEALDAALAIGDRRMEAASRYNLAVRLAARDGPSQTARPLLEDAMRIATECGYPDLVEAVRAELEGRW